MSEIMHLYNVMLCWINLSQSLSQSQSRYVVFCFVMATNQFRVDSCDWFTVGHSGYGLSQWKTTLHCNVVSHRLRPRDPCLPTFFPVASGHSLSWILMCRTIKSLAYLCNNTNWEKVMYKVCMKVMYKRLYDYIVRAIFSQITNFD